MGDGFHRPKDPTNSIKVLKENLQKKNQNANNRIHILHIKYTLNCAWMLGSFVFFSPFCNLCFSVRFCVIFRVFVLGYSSFVGILGVLLSNFGVFDDVAFSGFNA